ncbi:MAG: protein kinase [Planctomycetota bacterium]|nr:protein kinase [Planctomycetota bacterium]
MAETVPSDPSRKPVLEVPGFVILEQIGRGGMGIVYKARQENMDRIVALKVLSPALASDPKFVERFIREARASAKLNHPRIVQGIDVGRAGPTVFFAMEYVDGSSLARLIREKGAIEWREAVRIAIQVAEALEHAHKVGMVHRDIKPDNILLTSRGDVKVVDLGLAKKIDSSGDNPDLTQAGKTVGTPYYISPEQARGDHNIDIRTDIYSLGATLYAAITGHPLFPDRAGVHAMVAHLTDTAPSPRLEKADVPESLVRVMARMLAKSPADRYSTPSEAAAELKAVLEDKPIPLARSFKGKSSLDASPTPARLAGKGLRGAAPAPERPRMPTGGPVPPVGRGKGAAGTDRGRNAWMPVAGVVSAALAVVLVAGLLATGGAKEKTVPAGGASKILLPSNPSAPGRKAEEVHSRAAVEDRAKAAAAALAAALASAAQTEDVLEKARRIYEARDRVIGTPSEAEWEEAMAAARARVEEYLAGVKGYAELAALRDKFAGEPLLPVWEKAIGEARRVALAEWEKARAGAARMADAGDFAGAAAAVKPFVESPVEAVAEGARREIERLASLERAKIERDRQAEKEAREKGQRLRYEMYISLLKATEAMDTAEAGKRLEEWRAKPEMKLFAGEIGRIANELKWLDEQALRACTELVTSRGAVTFSLGTGLVQKGKVVGGQGTRLLVDAGGGVQFPVPIGKVDVGEVMAACKMAGAGRDASIDGGRYLFWRNRLEDARARLETQSREDPPVKELLERIELILAGDEKFFRPGPPRRLAASVPRDKLDAAGRAAEGAKDVPVDVSWTAGSRNTAKFRVERQLSPGGRFETAGEMPAGTTRFRDEKVPLRAQVTYRIVAVNAAGESDPSPEFTLVTPPPASPPNLLKNGDFEDGLNGWAVRDFAVGTVSHASEGGRSGRGAVAIRGFGSADQIVKVTPGRKYKVTGWIKITSQSGTGWGGMVCGVLAMDFTPLGTSRQFFLQGDEIGEKKRIRENEWTPFSFTFEAKGGEVRFGFGKFSDRSVRFDAMFDDLALVELQ